MTIVWLQGWGFEAEVWQPIKAEFSEFAHIAVSYRAVTTPAQFIPCVEQQIAHVDSFVVIGWSLGSMIGLELAEQNRGRAKLVVALASSARFVREDRRLGWPQTDLAAMRSKLRSDPSGTIARFSELMLTTEERRRNAHAILERAQIPTLSTDSQVYPAASLSSGLRYLESRDLTRTIEKKLTPALWIHGGLDKICPVGGFHELRSKMEGDSSCRFLLNRKQGHASFFFEPKSVSTPIKQFIDEYDHR